MLSDVEKYSMVSKAGLERKRQNKSSKAIISCMVDRIKKANERGFSGVMFAIS